MACCNDAANATDLEVHHVRRTDQARIRASGSWLVRQAATLCTVRDIRLQIRIARPQRLRPHLLSCLVHAIWLPVGPVLRLRAGGYPNTARLGLAIHRQVHPRHLVFDILLGALPAALIGQLFANVCS